MYSKYLKKKLEYLEYVFYTYFTTMSLITSTEALIKSNKLYSFQLKFMQEAAVVKKYVYVLTCRERVVTCALFIARHISFVLKLI